MTAGLVGKKDARREGEKGMEATPLETEDHVTAGEGTTLDSNQTPEPLPFLIYLPSASSALSP